MKKYFTKSPQMFFRGRKRIEVIANERKLIDAENNLYWVFNRFVNNPFRINFLAIAFNGAQGSADFVTRINLGYCDVATMRIKKCFDHL